MLDRNGWIAFAAILASCIGGGFGISAWIILASASILMLLSFSRHDVVIARLGSDNATAQAAAMLSTVMNAGLIASAAFFAGRIIGAVWAL